MSKKVFVILLFYGLASATIIHIPDSLPTIQEGIDAASNGDTVLVGDGQYYERINFLGKNIVVSSEFLVVGDTMHIHNTIIDADTSVLGVVDTGSVVVFVNGEDSTAVLQGFTIQNGIGTPDTAVSRYGGGIFIDIGSSPSVMNCILRWNSAVQGAGIGFNSNSYSNISNCLFTENTASSGGGAIHNRESNPRIYNCKIMDNIAWCNGGGINNRNYMNIENCLVTGNWADDHGSGICLMASGTASADINNCTIADNVATGPGTNLYMFSNSSALIRNSVIWGHPNPIHTASGVSLTITYSDTEEDWPGEGNINSNPQFISGPSGDYYLSQLAAGQSIQSPCVDVGSDLASNLGMETLSTRTDEIFDEVTVDMGYHYPGVPIDCGDANGSGQVTSADGYLILNYLGSGPMPISCWAANVNGDNVLTTADGFYILNYLGAPVWPLNCQPCE
jgi:predicted outer membrane repeat protein